MEDILWYHLMVIPSPRSHRINASSGKGEASFFLTKQ